MPKAPDNYSSLAICDDPGKTMRAVAPVIGYAEPGAAMRVVAEKLAAHGFDVRGPDWEEGPVLTVTGLRDTACDVTVDDSGFVTWEYSPRGDGADPDKIVSRVLRLLTDRSAAFPCARRDPLPPGAGVKGLVGRRLKAEGLEVCLDVYEDHVSYQVTADLTLTNPGQPERGRVNVTDEGDLMWECGLQEDASDTVAIADVIAAILAADIADGCIGRGEAALASGRQGNR